MSIFKKINFKGSKNNKVGPAAPDPPPGDGCCLGCLGVICCPGDPGWCQEVVTRLRRSWLRRSVEVVREKWRRRRSTRENEEVSEVVVRSWFRSSVEFVRGKWRERRGSKKKRENI